jgi:DNA-binding phage protein
MLCRTQMFLQPALALNKLAQALNICCDSQRTPERIVSAGKFVKRARALSKIKTAGSSRAHLNSTFSYSFLRAVLA